MANEPPGVEEPGTPAGTDPGTHASAASQASPEPRNAVTPSPAGADDQVTPGRPAPDRTTREHTTPEPAAPEQTAPEQTSQDHGEPERTEAERTGPAGVSPGREASDEPGTDATTAIADPEPGTDEREPAEQIERRLLGTLLSPAPTDRLWGWLGPAILAIVAGVARVINLGHPGRIMFDETYYVKQAYSLLVLGYEGQWDGDEVNDEFRDGDYSGLSSEAAYVVHPPTGKWLIALGMRALNTGDGYSWRIAAAIAGALSVFLLARIARRLFASTWLGLAAGAFMALDGLHFTSSRIGLLDVFLMVFILAGFGAVLLDRDQARRRLARAVAAEIAEHGKLTDVWGPGRLGVRWWLVLAGVLLGIGMSVKWSGLYAVAAFGLLVVGWDIAARRRVGVKLWVGGGAFRGGLPAFVALVPTALVTYVAGWWSWFVTPDSYMRQWAADEWAANGTVERSWLPHALNSLWEYHLRMYGFHSGLDSEHTYMSHPLGWLVQWRPTSFYWQSPAPEGETCAGERCVQAITSVGNPVIWWLGAIALLVVLWAALRHRDWRAWAIVAGYGATYVPWFLFAHRTIFTFYMIVLVPFVALALTYALARIGGLLGPPLLTPATTAPRTQAGGATAPDGAPADPAPAAPVPSTSVPAAPVPSDPPADGSTPIGTGTASPGATDSRATTGVAATALLDSDSDSDSTIDPTEPVADPGADPDADSAPTAPRRRRAGVVLMVVVLALAAAAMVYFWPVWTGATISYEQWHLRMWLDSWV